MAYTILYTDGTTLLLLADGIVDQSSTSLDLFGRNVNSYGEYLQNNLIKLLGNSANNTHARTPITGQLWYDTTSKKIKVYDNGFKTLSGAIVSASQPTSLTNGDLWWDTTNDQLRVYNANSTHVIGPAFSKEVGDNGWVLPNVTINSFSNNPIYNNIPQNVTLLRNYGEFIGIISSESFNMSSEDSMTYFNSPNRENIVSGLTINGDIKYTGQISNKFLSASFDINTIAQNTSTVSTFSEYNFQNSRIKSILEKMYPVTANPDTQEIAVPLGVECRTVCKFESDGGGIQIRRFRVIDDPGQGVSWQPLEVYEYAFNIGLSPPFPSTELTNVVYQVSI